MLQGTEEWLIVLVPRASFARQRKRSGHKCRVCIIERYADSDLWLKVRHRISYVRFISLEGSQTRTRQV